MKLPKPLLYLLAGVVAAGLAALAFALRAIWPLVVLVQLGVAVGTMVLAVRGFKPVRKALIAVYALAALGAVIGMLDGASGIVAGLVGGAGAALIAKTTSDYFAPVSFPLGAALAARLAKLGGLLPESESVLGLRVVSTKDLRVFLVGEIGDTADSRRAQRFAAAAKRGVELLARQGMSVSAVGVVTGTERREDGAVVLCGANEIETVLQAGEVSLSAEALREMGVGRDQQRAYRKSTRGGSRNPGSNKKIQHNGRVTKSIKER